MEMSQFSSMLRTWKLSRGSTTIPVKRCAMYNYQLNEQSHFHTGGFSHVSVFIQVLRFVHGERHKYVEVQIVDDAVPEGAERFQLILSRPSSGLTLGTNTTGTARKKNINYT